ncbi:MAG: beta galactosidase jelly roll domain-containing protein [Bacteroidales bacterium]|nr:beta galactosidase jelly roll domain-containing protein [Bacteroidales bacterium]
MKKALWLIIPFIFTACKNNPSELEIPSLFSDNMVLQQQANVPFWGWASSGTVINIETSWGDDAKVKASKDSKWKAEIKTPVAGGPYKITISTGDTALEISNVYIGEVWLCSGQSNMEMPLMGWPPKDTINYSNAEIEAADYPEIRMFTVIKALSFREEEWCAGEWQVCSPNTAGSYSATAYFFGRELYKKLGVPIGLIHASWGGTPAESWTSGEYLEQLTDYKEIVTQLTTSESEYEKFENWVNTLKAINVEELPSDTRYRDMKFEDDQYSLPDYDCSTWKTMQLPCLWETSDLGNFDGVVWFRKEFELPENIYPEGFTLYLGPVDDMDITYINGIEIGSMLGGGFWNVDRNYTIPESCLKKGKNVIAVRVTDPQGGGGIYGENISIMKGNKEVLSLSGDWKYIPVALKMGNNYYQFGEGDKGFNNKPSLALSLDASTPSVLYNAMIAPLIPYTIKGAIWYQGEANVGRGLQYRELFPKMIRCWRDNWAIGPFPFYYVQIAPFNYSDNGSGATPMLRDAQLRTMKVENTGMVVTTDIANPITIHPGNKQDVGKRLALWALAKTYGDSSITFSGPIYKGCELKEGKAIISFDYVDGGLASSNGDLSWFEIAGSDTAFIKAKATIDGENVVVWSEKVIDPKFVRFGWSDVALPNLFNKEGLPASPFITF